MKAATLAIFLGVAVVVLALSACGGNYGGDGASDPVFWGGLTHEVGHTEGKHQ